MAVKSSSQLDIYLVHAHLFGDHRHVNVFICMLNFCGWSQLQNYFNSEIFPICTIKPAPSAPYKMTWRPKLVMILGVEHFWLSHSVCFWNVDTLLHNAHDHVGPLSDRSHTLRGFHTGLQGGNNDLLGWDMPFETKFEAQIIERGMPLPLLKVLVCILSAEPFWIKVLN